MPDNKTPITLTPIQEKALREIFAWGSCYPLRPAEMAQLDHIGLVRRMHGLSFLGDNYWEITPEGRAWIRGRSDYDRPVGVGGSLQ